MDKFIIRATAILVNAYIPVVMFYSYNGVDISDYDYIFSSSVLLGVILTILSHTQGKYHCKWMRFLCYNSTAVPTIGFIDSRYIMFEDAMEFIYVISALWVITILATLILAINHFRRVRKVKKSRYKEYGIKR